MENRKEEVIKEENALNQKRSKKKLMIINICIISVILIAVIVLGIIFFDNIKSITSEDSNLSDIIKAQGIVGVLLLVLIQIAQVVIAIIPGEVIEVTAGLLYGPIWGTIICYIGLFISTLIIFGLVRLLGKPFVEANVKKERKHFAFLDNETRALTILFFIFLIPGTPKDVFTYLVPLSKVRLIPFFVVTSIARLPSVLSSTLVGAALLQGDTTFALIVTIISAVLAILGLLFNKKITAKIESMVNKRHDRLNKNN